MTIVMGLSVYFIFFTFIVNFVILTAEFTKFSQNMSFIMTKGYKEVGIATISCIYFYRSLHSKEPVSDNTKICMVLKH